MIHFLLYLVLFISLADGEVVTCGGVTCPSGTDCFGVNEQARCVDPCSDYTVVNDTWRSIYDTNTNNNRCDARLVWEGWYRFYLGPFSAYIPDRCIESGRCASRLPLWIKEPHPTQINEIVNRSVCLTFRNTCCYFPPTTIQVKLCPGNYYIYKVNPPPFCSATFCAASEYISGFKSVEETHSSITLQWDKVTNVSYVLKFNGAEINISAPAGDGPVTYTVSSLSAGTEYTFTLFSVFENFRSVGVQLTASTDDMERNICTVTGPTVIDFHGGGNTVADQCGYSLLSDSAEGFQVIANFRDRRRRDVSFLDGLTIRQQDSNIHLQLEQGGRIRFNRTELTLNSSAQQFHGVEISKDETGVTAKFSNPPAVVFFDGSTAQILIQGPVGSSVDGLCVNSSSISNAKVAEFSSSSCGTQYEDPVDSTVNCTLMTKRCNALKESPFSPCNDYINPVPYINACSDTLCKYPSVDGVRCQFLWAYARACSLNSRASLGDWWSAAKCPSPEVFCQDKVCSDHEFCGETFSGGTGCLCRAVFAHDYKQSNTLTDLPVCSQNSGSITLIGCLLEEKGIDFSTLHLNNQSCRGKMDEENHMVTFSFDSSNTCGTEIMNNGSQTIYKNSINNQNSSDLVVREGEVRINFSCYETQPEVKTVVFRIKDSSVIQHITSGEWSYTLIMQSYNDAGRTQAVDLNTEVMLNQKVWVELKTVGLDADEVTVVTDACWATSQEPFSSLPRHDLIKNGCADDETVQVEENGEGTSSYFSFNMFQFTGSPGRVYLHCKLQLCVKENTCKPVCTGGENRRRRSAETLNGAGFPVFISMTWIH